MLNNCEHGGYAVVVYEGKKCPFCELEQELEDLKKENSELAIELENTKSELEEIKDQYSDLYDIVNEQAPELLY